MVDITQTATGLPVEWADGFLEQLCLWRDKNLSTAQKVVRLIEAVLATPGEGIGRPKRLATVPGVWSRRITRHHRLHYVVTDTCLTFISCRGHDFPEELRDELRHLARRP